MSFIFANSSCYILFEWNITYISTAVLSVICCKTN